MLSTRRIYTHSFSARLFSTLVHARSKCYEGHESDPHSKVKVVRVGEDGAHVTLSYGKSSSSTYHASWLFSNDPKKVTLPSGQRTCTPGQWCSVYGKPKIGDATIIYCDVNREAEALSSFKTQIPGPTHKDSCHPLSIYGDHQPWITTDCFVTNAENVKLRPYLQVNWSFPHNKDTIQLNSKSFFDIEWLERFRYDDNSRRDHRKSTEIQPSHAIRSSGPPLRYSMNNIGLGGVQKSACESITHETDGLVHVKYNSIVNEDGSISESGLLNLLDAVFCDGAAIISESPRPETMESVEEDTFPVACVAKAMSGGSLSHGALYNNIFHVREGEANAKNVAYTSVALCPHQDLVYYESPPGIQLLHCVAMGKSVVGGESTLIDALAAAHRLREIRPESFEYLVKCPATFVKQRNGACMTYRRPHIALAEEGRTEDCSSCLFDREIVAVHWSPPFEGPVLLPPDDVDRYYEAYADFEQMLDNSLCARRSGSEDLNRYANEYTWEKKLAPGNILVFNNRR